MSSGDRCCMYVRPADDYSEKSATVPLEISEKTLSEFGKSFSILSDPTSSAFV